MQDLRDKAVLITGAASGIGRATALEFAREGADPLILNDINAEGLEATAALLRDLDREAVGLPADVSDFGAVREMVETALDRVGRIDVLVNVAGTAVAAPLELLDISDWRKVLGVNLFGMLHTVNLVYPHMLERGSGHIANVASLAGLMVFHQYNAPYNVSKYGAVGFSEELMMEASVHGIGVTCVCPGGVKTPIYDTAVFRGFNEGAREELKKLLLASGEEPEDTARALVKAVKQNRFLVVTTPVAKGAYFLKRHLSFVWYPFMRMVARLVAKHFGRYRTQER